MRHSLFFIVGLLWTLVSCNETTPSTQPNVIFILMDDLGYGQSGFYNQKLKVADFDSYFTELVNKNQGYELKKALDFSKQAMPTMHKLAEEGMLFTKAFTSNSLCAPSRMGIATGILQSRMGIYRNTDCEGKGLEPNSHLAERIKAQGYATAHIGKWHVGKRNQQLIIDVLKKHGIEDTVSYGQTKKVVS